GLLMALALCWVGAPYLLMSFTHSYWTLLACAGLVGIGNNFWHPTAIPLLARAFPERKGFVVSIHGMGGNVGDALAPLAAGVLLASMSWRNVVVVNIVPGILMACVILVLVGGMNVASEHAGGGKVSAGLAKRLHDLRELLRNQTLVMISLGSAFRAMTQSALLTFLPLYLARQMGYPPKWIGVCMFSLQAAGFLMTPIAGHFSDRMGRQRIIVSSMAMTMVVLLGMAFAGRSSLFVILVAFLGFFLFAVRSVLQAWLLDSTPSSQGGTAIGILFGSQALGAAIGPVTGGVLADHYGINVVFYFLAGTIVIANLFVFFTPTPDRRSAV
ncbi:MAG: MFS transporter, partial [Xanthobacteraceae bacterium]